jgi:hypothetical protein
MGAVVPGELNKRHESLPLQMMISPVPVHTADNLMFGKTLSSKNSSEA